MSFKFGFEDKVRIRVSGGAETGGGMKGGMQLFIKEIDILLSRVIYLTVFLVFLQQSGFDGHVCKYI